MRPALMPLIAALAACSPDTHDGSQVGTETGFGCLVDTTEPAPDTGATPTGFSASVAELVSVAEGRFEGILTHGDDAGGEALTLELAARGAPTVLRRSWRSDDSGEEIATIGTGDCPDVVRQPVTVIVVSGTTLDETFEADVLVDTEGGAVFHASIDLDALQGDARPTVFDPTTMDAVRVLLSGTSTASGWDGEVSFQGESTSGSGPDATASATFDPWGDFTTTRSPAR